MSQYQIELEEYDFNYALVEYFYQCFARQQFSLL